MSKAFKNILFHTGRTIPQIGYGTYKLKGEDCIIGVKTALKLGYRHIDAAAFYKNEQAIRQAILESGVKRQEIYLTSKLNTSQSGYTNAIKGCQQILKKLGESYLDLLLIHWPGIQGQNPQSPNNATIRRQTWRAMQDIKKSGIVRDIGVSNFLVRHMQDLMKSAREKPVINQFQLHPLLWQADLIEYCKKNEIVIQGYSPLARNDDKLMKNNYMLQLSQKYRKTTAQIALRWAIQNNFVTIPKSKTSKYMEQNLNILDFEMTQQEILNIKNLNDGTHTCWNPQIVKY